MKKPIQDVGPRAPKEGDRTGTTCPLCGEPVLRQEVVGNNGLRQGTRLVCSKRGCPYQATDR